MNGRRLKEKNASLKIGALVIAIYVMIVAFFPGAVENNGDITDKLLVVTVGLDKAEDGLCVSGIAAQPQSSSGGEGGQVSGMAVSAEGRSIIECLNKIQQKTGRVVDLGLCGVVVIGKSIAREGVKTLLETALSSNLVSPGAFVISADGCSAKQFMEMSAKSTDSATVILTQLLKDAERNTGAMANTLLRFLSETGGRSASSCMPLMSFTPSEGKQKEGGKQDSGQVGEYEASGIEQMAVYKDGKMIGRLSKEQSKGLTWVDHHVRQGVIVKQDFTVLGQSVGTVSAELASKSYSISVDLDDGVPKAKIRIKAAFRSADRERVNRISMQIGLKAEQLDQIYAENFRQEIEAQVSSALSYCKQNQVDLFGIEQELYRFKTGQYKRFIAEGRSVLEESEISLDVQVKIQ